MDFTLSETAGDVGTLAADITTKVCTPERVADLEARGADLDTDLWRAVADAGLLGLELSPRLAGDAGGGLGITESIAVGEQLGATLARIPFGPHAVAAAPALARWGGDEWSELIRDAATGQQVVTVALEEDHGDAFAPSVALAPGGTLTGSKCAVPFATAADAMLVTATGPGGPTVVVVLADDPRVRVVATSTTGLTPTATVDFDGAAVAGELSGGAAAVTELLHRARIAVCADQIGVLARSLSLTAEYARERQQFGRPIGSFQAVAQRLADGYIDVQALRLTTTQAAWVYDRQVGDSVADAPGTADLANAVNTAKFWACEAGHRVAHTAVHVHGGVGIDTSHPVHRYFLRAEQNQFTLGTAPVMLEAIGAALAGGAP